MQALDQGLLDRGAQLWNESRDVEKLLHFLRMHGISKLDSVKAVRSICRVSLGEAKNLVSSSVEWRDITEAANSLHEQVISALESNDEN